MDLQNEKCVMVIDENLPLGIIANTAAIMGVTLGKRMPEAVGADVQNRSGREHLGIIEFPVPVLKSTPEAIRQLRETLYHLRAGEDSASVLPAQRNAPSSLRRTSCLRKRGWDEINGFVTPFLELL